MKDLTDYFDGSHKKRIEAYLKQLDVKYTDLINALAKIAVQIHIENPKYSKLADAAVLNYIKELSNIIKNGITSEWDLANIKMDAVQKATIEKLKNRITSEAYETELNAISKTTHNKSALEAFQRRKIGKFTISERVWNIGAMAKENIELAIDLALKDGISAQELSREIKKNLNNPDALYRRIRDKHGKAYKPGQGVYRSAHKNALRLAANEINTAYREAEQLRLEQNSDVVGVKIHLSPSHTIFDMCFTNWMYKITTSKGLKNIKDIEVGDLVLTHKGRFRPVTQLFKSFAYEVPQTEIYYKIPYDNRSKTHKISATDNHPFLINGEWKPISEAKEGDFITILSTSPEVKAKDAQKDKEIQRVVYNHEPISKVVHKIRKQSTPITKWNFAVEEDNSYVCNNIVVHNCDVLKGEYPKNFKWSKWHINCKCYRTSILKSDEEIISEITSGRKEPPEKSANFVGKTPPKLHKWVDDNADKMKNWKRKPEFIENNSL